MILSCLLQEPPSPSLKTMMTSFRLCGATACLVGMMILVEVRVVELRGRAVGDEAVARERGEERLERSVATA